MTPRLAGELERIDRTLLGARIRRHRRAARLKQSQLSGQVGVTAAYLSRIETGERRPSPTVLENIASRLHVDVDQLLIDHSDGEAEAAAQIVAVTVARWLRDPTDPTNYDHMIEAVRRWEATSGD